MAIPLLAAPLLGWLSGLAGKFLSDYLLRFIAWKILLFTLITITLPIVLKNVIVWVFEEIITASSAIVNIDGMQATVLNLTGAAGYMAYYLMLPDCIAILMTAIVIRFTLNFIPFVG